MPRPRLTPLAGAGWLAVFAVLAILNAGGYRYGATDQAFYIPAVAHHADPSLFPRDWAMLGAQDQLNAFTPLAGWLTASIGLPLPALFLGLFVLTLAALGVGALTLGARLGASRWTAVALLSALTLRHAVALGAVNTIEGYTHPRVLAFAIGVIALAALLGGGRWPVVGLVALAGVVHPTTGVWFAVTAGVGLLVAHRDWRPWLLAGAAVVAALAGYALWVGPLSARLVRMDPDWLSVLASKRYLFPDRWPASEWLVVTAYAAVIALVFRVRRRAGLAANAETGVIAGIGALVALFAATLPLNAARIAFFVQLQAPRVLWLVDLVAVAYLVWLLAEWRKGPGAGGRGPEDRRARAVALVILALSLGRGLYVSFVEHPERALVQVDLPATDWNGSLAWIDAHTPTDALVVADPGHAWRHGTSVRVGATRDVLLEEVKDTAMAMYSRPSAARVLDRIRALDGFGGLTTGRARDLAVRYGASVLVIDRDMALPLLHRQGPFRIYALSPRPPRP